MDGRAFLDVARALAAGPSEAFWRSAVGRAYYAALQEGAAALSLWGFNPRGRESIHSFVRLRLTYAADPDLSTAGTILDHLAQLRNYADYQLSASGPFVSGQVAMQSVNNAAAAIALVEHVHMDSPRRAAAIADIGARWP